MSCLDDTDHSNQYIVLVVSFNAYGHVNASLGVGSILADRGHKVYYLGDSKHRATAERQGITHIPIEDYIEKNVDQSSSDKEKLGKVVKSVPQNMSTQFKTPIEKLRERQEMATKEPEKIQSGYRPIVQELETINDILPIVVDKIKPHVILEDLASYVIPYMMKTSVHHVKIISVNPILLYPGVANGSGLSVNESKETWNEYIKLKEPYNKAMSFLFAPMFEKAGLKPVEDVRELLNKIKDFGVYIYPEAIDYKELGKPKGKWIRLDAPTRKISDGENFTVPDCLKGKPGKLILFSTGTIVSSIISLMQPLLDTLGKSPHRFIVSKGPLGDQLKLPDNCWGENYINQLAILPHVDLVISHGGNNTFIETLAAGKPMIILPYFADQPDNAQRVVDLGIGKRFWPFGYDEAEFLQAIDELVNDKGLQEKMEHIGQSIRASDSDKKFIEAVEELIKSGKSSV